ncbi:MAG TPA: EAL domain-containing protein [Stellaceae bacterium]|nr:EAL domain-containing protein [Stellaceae bacterium]
MTLAFVLCVIMAFSAVGVFARVRLVEKQERLVWFGAALVFGCGLWGLHFVALASYAAEPVGFALNDTLASLVVAIVGTMAASAVYLHGQGRLRGAIVAGILLGGAAVATHLLGVASMRTNAGIVTDTTSPIASLAVAVLFSILLFARAPGALPAPRRLEAVLYLVAALGGANMVGLATLVVSGGGATGGTELGTDALPLALGACGFVILALSLAADVLERHVLNRVQQESGRLLQLVGAAFEGIVIHRDGVIIETNQAFRQLGDWTDEALRGRRLADLAAETDTSELERWLKLSDDKSPALSFGLLATDGHTIPVEVVSRAIEHEGAPACVAGVRDLTSRVRAEERIQHLAHHDALTGLPNRFLLVDRLTHALTLAKRNPTTVAVFHLDLDRFKAVNDLLGHEAGDELLIEVGRRLHQTLRASDTLARLGADEFVIVQALVQSPREAAGLARRVVDALSEPFFINGQRAQVGVSVGIALYPQDGETAADLMHNADTAMYRAKREGSNAFLFFEPAMDRHIQERRHLEQDLRQAITRGELELHYQPLFDCGDTTISGFEALLRWKHPGRGMISPGEFIPLAEECGLITLLGRWVLERACAEAAGWTTPHRIAVNLSPIQFRQHDLPEMVEETLQRAGLAPQRLELEITEGVLIDNTERAVEVLAQLKALGVNISLDDFGTGYSSLSYLRRFPFDKIKIDQSFVRGLGQDEEAAAIVKAIVALARSLRLSITAEGVETEDQLAALKLLECNQVQGFLLGRPMPVQQLSALTGGPSEEQFVGA